MRSADERQSEVNQLVRTLFKVAIAGEKDRRGAYYKGEKIESAILEDTRIPNGRRARLELEESECFRYRRLTLKVYGRKKEYFDGTLRLDISKKYGNRKEPRKYSDFEILSNSSGNQLSNVSAELDKIPQDQQEELITQLRDITNYLAEKVLPKYKK